MTTDATATTHVHARPEGEPAPPEFEWLEVRPARSSPYDRNPKPYVTVVPHDFAHGVWTALGVTLAEPLRRAFWNHVNEHGCPGGIVHCDEAMALWDLLPDGDRIVYA